MKKKKVRFGSGAIDDFETRVESRERISWTSMMVGGRQDENDSGEMLRRATRRIKGEYIDRIGGDYPPFDGKGEGRPMGGSRSDLRKVR